MPITDKNGQPIKPLSLIKQKHISEEVGRGKPLVFVVIVTSFHHSHRERKMVKKILYGQDTNENLLYCGISGDDMDEAISCVEALRFSQIPFVVISPHCLQLQNLDDHSWDSLVVQMKLKFFTNSKERAKFRPNTDKLNQGYYLLFNTKTKKLCYLSQKQIEQVHLNEEESTLINFC